MALIKFMMHSFYLRKCMLLNERIKMFTEEWLFFQNFFFNLYKYFRNIKRLLLKTHKDYEFVKKCSFLKISNFLLSKHCLWNLLLFLRLAYFFFVITNKENSTFHESFLSCQFGIHSSIQITETCKESFKQSKSTLTSHCP